MDPASRQDTVPGFTLQSPNFMVKFISGLQRGNVSKILEYDTDWMEVMTMVLDILEMFPKDLQKVETVLAKSLEDWIVSHEGAENLNISATAKLKEKIYFTPPLGSKKSLCVSFTDKFKTEVIFHVKKRSTMKSLKDLSLAAVAEYVHFEKDLLSLELPVTLHGDLTMALSDGWTPRRFRDNIECVPNYYAYKDYQL